MLYADASKSEAYKRGICTWTKLSATQSGDTLTVEIAPVESSYPGMINARAYEVRLPGDWPPQSVSVNGRPLSFAGQDQLKPGWRYEGNTLMTVITTPHFSVHTPVRIEVRRAAGSLASRNKLDGFAGSITRLRAAYDTLNALWPFTWSPDPLIDAWQTGDRLSYHPEDARSEVARFPSVYAQALANVTDLVNKADIPEDQLEKQLMQHRGADTAKDRARNYKLYLTRALALLKDGKPQ
jgi:Domain of unknown function (DUF5110)